MKAEFENVQGAGSVLRTWGGRSAMILVVEARGSPLAQLVRAWRRAGVLLCSLETEMKMGGGEGRLVEEIYELRNRV